MAAVSPPSHPVILQDVTTSEGLVLAVIPARGGSRGVPRKHFRLLGGVPLIAHTLRAALDARRLTHLIVSTDDPAIRVAAASQGVDAPFLRPAELSTDDAPTTPVIAHAVEWFERRIEGSVALVVTLQPTSPFRTAAHVDAAIGLMDDPAVDSAVTVASTGQPVSILGVAEGGRWRGLHPPNGDVRRQVAPEAMRLTGGIYVTRREVLRGGRLIGDAAATLVLDALSAMDIDTLDDLGAARAALRRSR